MGFISHQGRSFLSPLLSLIHIWCAHVGKIGFPLNDSQNLFRKEKKEKGKKRVTLIQKKYHSSGFMMVLQMYGYSMDTIYSTATVL